MEVPKIKKLHEDVVNKIAAGEVIQRPANALKELIENSLDAGSKNIQITVKNGGLKLLQIQDDGTGICKDDFEIVCERFTTSKLEVYDDLNTISTYGFRGEALASISHVAHLTIISKTANEACAYKASFIDGKIVDKANPCAGNQGTQITVEDLFYNMSVRKRALRSPAEEYQKIADVVGKYAVHNAAVGFGLKKSGESNNIKTPTNSNHIDNIRIIYGNTIARELIEFSLVNDSFKIKAHGFMTNVNYSTKKLTFLLFINHRLVDCPSLKKCIDQVYATYLPKNSHPFVYLSVELDSRMVDVNVHPTKHEVHFMNEEQIIELITKSLETKLLGSNNSRAFYTQAKLPGVQIQAMPLVDRKDANRTIHPKELIRTDATEQKLEKFFGAPVKNIESAKIIDTSKIAAPSNIDDSNSEEFALRNEEFLRRNESFENKLHTDSNAMKKKEDQKKEGKMTLSPALISKLKGNKEDLTSVLQLRKEIEDNCHMTLRELFAQHVFVGCVDTTQCIVQHSTKLYLCNTQTILNELFYQLILYNFKMMDMIQFGEPLKIYDLALMALDLPETGWTADDGAKTELARRITEILTDNSEMLADYFSMEIDKQGFIKSIPLVLDKYIPDEAGFPMYILRLATEVNWQDEKECFKSFSYETALYYSRMNDKDDKWRWTTEHVLYPAIKDYFLPPKVFVENAAILQIADLPKLYKVFERC